jgi:hypothetical protein
MKRLLLIGFLIFLIGVAYALEKADSDTDREECAYEYMVYDFDL